MFDVICNRAINFIQHKSINENRAVWFFKIMDKQTSHEPEYSLMTRRVVYGKILRPIAKTQVLGTFL